MKAENVVGWYLKAEVACVAVVWLQVAYVALLGKPDSDRGGEASYELGFCQTFVDPDTLDFYFDSHGVLTRHAITNH